MPKRKIKFFSKNKKLLIFELEIIFYLFIILILLFDQLSKVLIQNNMQIGQSIPLLKNVLHLTYVRNTGAAFSLFEGFSFYLTVVGMVVAAVVFYFHLESPITDFLTQSALAFILGGSLGNLADRLFRGHVVDFIDFRVWPVFNLADVMINAGVLMLVFRILRKGKKGASRII